MIWLLPLEKFLDHVNHLQPIAKKKKKKSMEDSISSFQTHHDDLATQLKATLYSLSVLDLADTKAQLAHF